MSSTKKFDKTFVLNPHAVIASANSLLRFGSDNEVIIPMCVLEQIRSFKKTLSFGKAKVARDVLEYITSFDIKDLTTSGVIQENGSNLMVATNYKDVSIETDGISDYDKRALQVALGEKKKDKNVIFITNNPILRMKANLLGIKAEPFKDELYPLPADQYTGRGEVYTSQQNLDAFFENGYMDIQSIFEYEKEEWCPNKFLVIKSEQKSALGRYDGEKIVGLTSIYQKVYGIKAKNVGQKFLLEAMMSDAPLVVVKGGAGTGKTFCSLAAGLQQTCEEQKYTQILVTRPIQTVADEKIGFLPGDIDDKVGPYLGGIKDNLRMLINSRKKEGEDKKSKEQEESGQYLFDKGIIRIQPIGYIRGRTIVDTYFIIDETQNLDPEDIKSIGTRAGAGSKFIFLGDPSQVDNPKLNERYNGLVYLSEKMKGYDLCYQITLNEEESVRGNLSKLAMQIL